MVLDGLIILQISGVAWNFESAANRNEGGKDHEEMYAI
jgi:hypothetical protein